MKETMRYVRVIARMAARAAHRKRWYSPAGMLPSLTTVFPAWHPVGVETWPRNHLTRALSSLCRAMASRA